LAIARKFLGEEHPDIATYYSNLGLAYAGKGNYDKAISYYEKGLAIDKTFRVKSILTLLLLIVILD
jgi:tetratricopeptide (TPR) repeat protein